MHYIKAIHEEHEINEDKATYYYEIDNNFICTRSVESYTDGTLLKYDQNNHSDQYGMLPDQPMEPMDDVEGIPEWRITKEEFEDAWSLPQKYP